MGFVFFYFAACSNLCRQQSIWIIIIILIFQLWLHPYTPSPSPAVFLAPSLRALQVIHFLSEWWCISCLSLAPWEPFCSVVHPVYVCVCLFVHSSAFMYLCVCTCTLVLVWFIPREDSFPQQVLSGCFWVHSVHSWRLPLSPAHLTSLLSSPLLRFFHYPLTFMSVMRLVNYVSPCSPH